MMISVPRVVGRGQDHGDRFLLRVPLGTHQGWRQGWRARRGGERGERQDQGHGDERSRDEQALHEVPHQEVTQEAQHSRLVARDRVQQGPQRLRVEILQHRGRRGGGINIATNEFVEEWMNE